MLAIVVPAVCCAYPVIIRIIVVVHILHGVAIAVIAHISVHIRHVVVDVDRCRASVAAWIVTPVPRRAPWPVIRSCQIGKDRRCGHIYRLYYVLWTVDVIGTDHLHIIRVCAAHFGHQGCNILIYVWCKYCLDHKHVSPAVNCLHHAQIVHVSVAVEVQVGQHVLRIVDKILKILYVCRLGKGRADGLQVQIQRSVIAVVANIGNRGYSMCAWHCNCGCWSVGYIVLRIHGNDTGETATCKKRHEGHQECKFFHICVF